MASLAWKAFRDQRWAAVAWGGGAFLLVLLHMAVFPQVAKDESLARFYESLPEGFQNAFGGGERPFNTIEGYLQVELGAYGPILLAVFAVTQAVKALAGQEQDGHMDFLLAQPYSRRRVVLTYAGVQALGVLAIATVAGLGLVLGALAFGIAVDGARLVLAMLNAVPLALAFGGLTLAVSGAAHSRPPPVLVGTVTLVASFFLNALAPLAQATRDLRWGSLFYHYQRSDAFGGTLDPLYVALGLGLWVAGVAAAVLAFDGKDVRS